MTIEECYNKLGGDYGEVSKRLPSISLIEKFLIKFLKDDSFENLCKGIEAGSRMEAFRAAHTLKGVCQNLGLGKLQDSAQVITEVLRVTDAQDSAQMVIPAEAKELLEAVKSAYKMTTETIQAYGEEKSLL